MARFVGGRLVDAIPVLLLSSLLVFAVLHLVPGDPVDAMMGAASFGISTPESQAKLVAQIRDQLGLNDPLPLQYLHWLGNALHLDLGESFIRHQSVSSLIAQRLPTLQPRDSRWIVRELHEFLFRAIFRFLQRLLHGDHRKWIIPAVFHPAGNPFRRLWRRR